MVSGITDKTRIQSNQAKLNAAKNSARTGTIKNEETINKAAEDFEAVFLAQMLEHMFAGVDLDPTQDGPGEEIYKSLLVDEYGKLLARTGGIGVADHVKREMIRMQENQPLPEGGE